MNQKFDIEEADNFDDPAEFYEAAQKVNNTLISEFENLLVSEQNIRRKSAQKHASNIEFFANEYLAGYEGVCLWQGYDDVSGFLGHWFIRKAMWANVVIMKENVISFQLFYDFLAHIGRIKNQQRKELEERINTDYPTWLERMARYDDPDFEGDWFTGEDALW